MPVFKTKFWSLCIAMLILSACEAKMTVKAKDGRLPDEATSTEVEAGQVPADHSVVDAEPAADPTSGEPTGKLNQKPRISVSTTGSAFPQNGTVVIAIDAFDSDDDATIDLFRVATSGACSSSSAMDEIVNGLVEGAVSTFSWQADVVGTFYICAKIDDRTNDPVFSVSTNAVTVNTRPGLSVSTTDTEVAEGAAITLNITASDPDDNADLQIFRAASPSDCIDGNQLMTLLASGLKEEDISTYSWPTSTAGTWFFCVSADDGINQPVFAVTAQSVRVNAPPTLSNVQPIAAVTLPQIGIYTLNFTATDADDNASLRIFRSLTAQHCDSSLQNWTLIADNLTEDAFSGFNWVTDAVPAGDWFICVEIHDGLNHPVYAQSSFAVTIDAPPVISAFGPPMPVVVPQVGQYAITAAVADPDSNAALRIFRSLSNADCDTSLQNWVQIASGLQEDAFAGYNWTTNAVPPGAWYLCIEADDGINPPVYAASTQAIQVNAAPVFSWTTSSRHRIIPATSYTVPYSAGDADDAAQIEIWLKATNTGACDTGTFLAALTEGVDTDFIWDVSGITTVGNRYLCATIDDGINPIISSHSSEQVFYRHCVWTGAEDTLWTNSNNWSNCQGTAPIGINALVLIPAAPVNQPTLTTNAAIFGFAPGSGGGTVTITSGSLLYNRHNWDFFISSDVMIRGDSPTCEDCQFRFSHSSSVQGMINEGATLTLGNGLSILGTNYLHVGDGTTHGHLETVADTGDPSTYPVLNKSANNGRGLRLLGSETSKSTIRITGLRVSSGYGTAHSSFLLESNWQVLALDRVIVERTYANGPIVSARACNTGVLSDTEWTGWVFGQDSVPSSIGTMISEAGCAGHGPVSITGSGRFFGAFGEYGDDLAGLYQWTNGDSYTCQWTGAISTDWHDPGNWASCANGRGGIPDVNDTPVITNGPVNQPVISSADVVLHSVNSGVGVGLGGTLTIEAGAEVQLARVLGDLALVGSTAACNTCLVKAPPRNLEVMTGATLTLGSGVSVLGNPVILRAGGTFHTDISSDITNEWPMVTNLQAWGGSTTLSINGLRIIDSSGTSTLVSLNGSGTISRFDRMILDTGNTSNDFAGTYIRLADWSSRVVTDTTWTEIDFVDGISGAGRNFNFVTQGGLTAGTVSVTPRTSGANQGYGALFATDTLGYIVWQ